MKRFFEDLFSRKHPVTKVLIVLNTVLYIVLVASLSDHSLAPQNAKTLIEWGGNYGPLTLHGEPWRLLTCTFMHSGFVHLLVNMVLLYCLGREMEDALGTRKYLFVYFLSAIVGALVSLESQPTLVSVGASGAIYGIFGSAFTSVGVTSFEQLIATLKRRAVVLLFSAAMIMVPAIWLPGIDTSAHFGGLFAGIAAGFCIAALSSKKFKPLAYCGLSALVILPVVAVFAISVQYKDDLRFKSQPLFVEAEAKIESKKWSEALPLLDQALSVFPQDADKKYNKERLAMLMKRASVLLELKRNEEALRDIEAGEPLSEENAPIIAMKALTMHRLKQYQTAADLYEEALKKKPGDPLIQNDLAWSQAATGQFDKALENVNKSLAQNDRQTAAIDTRGTVYLLKNKYDEARADLDRAIRLNPKEGAAYFHRAGVSLSQNETAKCDDDLKTALELDYKPDTWEPKFFKELDQRYSELKARAKS